MVSCAAHVAGTSSRRPLSPRRHSQRIPPGIPTKQSFSQQLQQLKMGSAIAVISRSEFRLRCGARPRRQPEVGSGLFKSESNANTQQLLTKGQRYPHNARLEEMRAHQRRRLRNGRRGACKCGTRSDGTFQYAEASRARNMSQLYWLIHIWDAD